MKRNRLTLRAVQFRLGLPIFAALNRDLGSTDGVKTMRTGQTDAGPHRLIIGVLRPGLPTSTPQYVGFQECGVACKASRCITECLTAVTPEESLGTMWTAEPEVVRSTFTFTKEWVDAACYLCAALRTRHTSFSVNVGDCSDVRTASIEFPTDIL